MSKTKYGICISKSWLIYIVFFNFFIFHDYLEDVVGILQYVDKAVALLAIPLFFKFI